MKNRWIVGAYAASPTRFGWVPEEEDAFLRRIYQLPHLRGLEVPFTNSLHKFDEEWFLNHLPKNLDLVITLIPGTTARVKENPAFGLASNIESGRSEAVNFVTSVQKSLLRAHQVMKRRSVIAIQLHTAPGLQETGGNSQALEKSLSELSKIDWQGAKLVIEHCDARVSDQPAEKGYLPLSQEIATIKAAGANFGITINWGRSAIETRSAQGPIDQVTQARQAGVLAGVMFSGAASVENRFGIAWKDCHVPPSPLSPAKSGRELLEPLSLMTSDEIRKTLQACELDGFDGYLGVKVAPLHEVTIEERNFTVAESLAVLEDAFTKVQ